MVAHASVRCQKQDDLGVYSSEARNPTSSWPSGNFGRMLSLFGCRAGFVAPYVCMDVERMHTACHCIDLLSSELHPGTGKSASSDSALSPGDVRAKGKPLPHDALSMRD